MTQEMSHRERLLNEKEEKVSEKLILHLRGIAVIEEGGARVETTIMGERWHLHIEGQPASLRDEDAVTVKVFLKEPINAQER